MKKTITIISVVATVGLSLGYYLGKWRYERILRAAPYTFYVQDAWRDCRSIRELGKGNVADVLHDLNMNLNQQVIQLWLIWKAAPSELDRKRARDLLCDISEHRSDFHLSPPDSKEGLTVYGILDEVKNEATK